MQHELGRLERSLEALLVDLAVAGDADRQQFPLAAGHAGLHHDVLQRVRGGHGLCPGRRRWPTRPGCRWSRCRGCRTTSAAGSPSNGIGAGASGLDGLDVGGVAGLEAADVGVLADLALGQELLRRAAAHRTRGRRDDDVLDAEPGQDPLVGVAVRLVGRRQALVGEVERVRVLHHELAAAQDAGAGTLLVAVLGLHLVQGDREVLVRVVLALHGEREELLVGGAEHVVVALAVLRGGTGVRRTRSSGSTSRRDRAAAARAAGSPAHPSRSSPRGPRARPRAAPADPAAATSTRLARYAARSRHGPAACGWRPRRRRGRRGAYGGTGATCG